MTCEKEHNEQKAFVKHIRKTYKDLIIFSVPNGGKRTPFEAKRLKDEGLLSGVLDLEVLLPKGRTLRIEFKKQKGGTISKTQKEFISNLDRLGHDHFIAYGCVDGATKFKEYLIFNKL